MTTCSRYRLMGLLIAPGDRCRELVSFARHLHAPRPVNIRMLTDLARPHGITSGLADKAVLKDALPSKF